ncbi:MAG TPA: DUF2158 domain-containing protein [Bradyrhizobium sp.]|nr:DUF2158 domain-containing protein [Bradyrhizobium sp.]
MTVIKSGDLVVLKSGGPVMTADTVNTDIFDDNKITGVLCVWFVGERLERVRFDHRALDLAHSPAVAPRRTEIQTAEATGEYDVVLDEMAAAMNLPAESDEDASGPPIKGPKPASAANYKAAADSADAGSVAG